MGSFALKLPIEVTEEDVSVLDGQSRICNWLYNHLLATANELKETFCKTKDSEVAKIVYSKRGLRDLLPLLKKEHSFLKVVHSSPLKNVALRLSDSIQRHQKSKKGARVFGWPRFRSWKEKWFSLFYDEPNKGFYVEGKALVLSLGMGEDWKGRSIEVRIPEASKLQGKQICNLRIIKELGKFYAVFTIKENFPSAKPINKVIALDPNHKNLSYGVDIAGKAVEIATPSWLKIYDKRIDELKSKRDRCQKKSKKCLVTDHKGTPTGKEYYLPSKQWRKCNQVLMRALSKRRDQTKTFLYTLAHSLYRKYGCVAIGDYTPDGTGENKQMRRAMNNRSLIGRFKEVVCWVAKKSGKTFHEYNERGTTRTCRHCSYVEEKGIHPSIRIWRCPACEAIHDRDENAAILGLDRTLQDLLEKTGIIIPIVSSSDLAFIQERWAWSVLPSGVLATPRGQDGDQIHNSRKLNRRRGSLRSKIDNLSIYDQV